MSKSTDTTNPADPAELFESLPPVRYGNSVRAEINIAIRHLMSKRSEAMVSVVTFVSVIGVLAAVSIVHVVLGVMSGFQEDLREKLLGTNAHITIQNMDQSEQSFGLIENYEEVIAHANSVDGVIAASPFLFSKTFIQTPTGVDWVVVKGVDPDRVSLVSDLNHQILPEEGMKKSEEVHTQGVLDSLRKDPDDADASPGMILGADFAEAHGLTPGMTVQLWNMNQIDRGPFGMPTPTIRKFHVSGVFRTGYWQYDTTWAYVANSEMQKFLHIGDRVTAVEVKLENIDSAPAISDALDAHYTTQSFPTNYYFARHWQEINKDLYAALQTEKRVSGLILFASVALASLLILNTLIMVVLTKGREIAILKALGCSRGAIRRIFILEGTLIGFVGAIGGTLLGLGACLFLKWYGWPLNGNVYLLDTLPVVIHPINFVIVAAAATSTCFVATLFPAHRAANLHPIDGLRYE